MSGIDKMHRPHKAINLIKRSGYVIKNHSKQNEKCKKQTLKKEGIFLELQFVGVRLYGRVEVLKKQATTRKSKASIKIKFLA